MTLALAAPCHHQDRSISVDGSSIQVTPFLTKIDGEYMIVTGGAAPIRIPPYPSPSSQTWQVERGALGSEIADHDIGATVDTAPAIGSGGMSVDNGTDPPAAVTTLVAPGADLAGDIATLPTVQMVVLYDPTGGTLTPSPGADANPAPVTDYTVVRDDLGAATDPSGPPVLPAGVYLLGGYIEFVVAGGTTGHLAAAIDVGGGIPNGANGPDVFLDVTDLNVVIPAPLKVAVVSGTTNARKLRMKLYWSSADPVSADVTWLSWVFYAIRLGS